MKAIKDREEEILNDKLIEKESKRSMEYLESVAKKDYKKFDEKNNKLAKEVDS